ncbi:MAG: class I adenylate-forming enzyme family protein [Acetobacteraceae bacterium]
MAGAGADSEAAALLAGLPSRISQTIRPWAAGSPHAPALVEAGRTISYRELADLVLLARARLVRAGVRPGDRVLLVAENGAALVVLLLALSELDAWAVLANARLSEPEVAAIRADSGARLVVLPLGGSAVAQSHARRLGAAAEPFAGLGDIGFTAADDATAPEPVLADGAAQVAALIYTSGTTGKPKGVMLTHRNLLYLARASAMLRHVGPGDRFVGLMPFTHVTGLSVVLLGTLMHGAALHPVGRFNPATLLAALREEGVSLLLGVPAMYALLLDFAAQRRLGRIEAPRLRLIGACGAPLDPALKERTEAFFGMPLHNGYGVTETSPTIAQTRPEAPRADVGLGPLMPGVQARILGPDGREVAPGEVGTLHVRGPGVMKGYYRAPEATSAVLDAEGWLGTGDLARFADGSLFVVGRARELIVRFGFNVYPPEVEAVLASHPAVQQVAVIGRRGTAEEEILAFVIPSRGSELSVEELARHAAERLAPYKRPTRILLVDTLPASGTGKILKHQLVPLAARLLGCG